MSNRETATGVVTSLKRRESSRGAIWEFQLQQPDGSARRIECAIDRATALRDGDRIEVRGPVDANGILSAEAIVRWTPPATALPRWWWLTVPVVVLLAQWSTEDAASFSSGGSVWDDTWLWASRRFVGWPPSEQWYRDTEDAWLLWLTAGVAAAAAARWIRPRTVRLLVRAAAVTIVLTSIGCWLKVWDPLMALRLSLILVSGLAGFHALYLATTGRRRAFAEPPAAPPIWWLVVPALATAGSWTFIMVMQEWFAVSPLFLVAGGLAVLVGGTWISTRAAVRAPVQAIGGAVTLVGLNVTVLDGALPVFGLLMSLAIVCVIAAAGLTASRRFRPTKPGL